MKLVLRSHQYLWRSRLVNDGLVLYYDLITIRTRKDVSAHYIYRNGEISVGHKIQPGNMSLFFIDSLDEIKIYL